MHRPPRRRVSVGHCIGGVDRTDHHRSTRPTVLRAFACVCLFAVAFVPQAAHAQTTQDQLSQTRSAIDSTANRWFAAHNDATNLDARIAQIEEEIKNAEARVDSARVVATQRALLMYKGAGVDYANLLGTTIVESVRRAELMDSANARNRAAIDALNASVKALQNQRQQLVSSRASLEKALQGVATERQSLDSQLASLQDAVQRKAAQAAHARNPVVRSLPTVANTPTADPTGPPRAAPLVSRVVPPVTGATYPHHNDPFLVCTRAHESGGNYGVVSASGVYYGAYQFLPSTWNATAVHAGRMDLVGVLPSRATAYDQDEMAWTLYQWQGNAPWGGRC